MNENEEYLGWDAPAWVYLESFHAVFAPKLKYKGEYITGGYFGRYSYDGISIGRAPLSSWLPYGRVYLNKLLVGDRDFVHEILSLVKESVWLADKFEKKNSEDISLNTITPVEDILSDYKRVFSYLVAYGWTLNTAIDRDSRVQKIINSDIPEYGQSFIWQENNDLYKIGQMSEGKDKNDAIKKHALKYSWILNNYNGDRNPGLAYFKDRLSNIKFLSANKNIKKGVPKTLAEWIGYLTYAQDNRKRLNQIVNGMLDRAVKAECKEMGHLHKDVMMLSIDEYEKQKRGKLKKYGNVRYFFTDHDGIHDITEQEWNNRFVNSIQGANQCKGMIANGGYVKGRVCVVLSPKDFYKVKAGDVLVSSMTRPEFSPVLSRVSAIVTNEGGITCHAAIVSRELRIPCVIGTKIATKVLKDGDLVEVDAKKGVIKIVKKF